MWICVRVWEIGRGGGRTGDWCASGLEWFVISWQRRQSGFEGEGEVWDLWTGLVKRVSGEEEECVDCFEGVVVSEEGVGVCPSSSSSCSSHSVSIFSNTVPSPSFSPSSTVSSSFP